MPHRGHTTIEMSPHRGRAERHEGHENPRVHETPVIIPPRTSRSPSPSNNRRHHDTAAHHTNVDNNHLTVGNAHHPVVGSSNGHSSTEHHDRPISGHHRSSHERLTPNDHHAPEDSTPLLFRTRREAIPPSDPETAVNVTSDLAKTKPDLKIDIDVANEKSQGLREPDATSPKPPIAGPEMDDLDEDSDIPNTAEAHPGVDDGLFMDVFGDHDKPDDHNRETDDEGHPQNHPEDPLFTPWVLKNGHDDKHPTSDDEGDGLMPRDPRLTPRFGPETPFPYAPEFAPGAVPPPPSSDVNVNVYQQKKNLAQGMMDLALLSANANQLRYVLEAGDYHPYYYASLIFISFSLILQIGVGVGLIINSTYDIKDRYEVCKADKINNFTVIGIFLITVVNVFVASFGVANLPQPNSTGPNI